MYPIKPYNLKPIFRTPLITHLGKILDYWNLLDLATLNQSFHSVRQVVALCSNYSSNMDVSIIFSRCTHNALSKTFASHIPRSKVAFKFHKWLNLIIILWRHKK